MTFGNIMKKGAKIISGEITTQAKKVGTGVGEFIRKKREQGEKIQSAYESAREKEELKYAAKRAKDDVKAKYSSTSSNSLWSTTPSYSSGISLKKAPKYRWYIKNGRRIRACSSTANKEVQRV